MHVRESTIEQELIEKLGDLKYTLRPDIRDRAALESNFWKHFEALNRVSLADTEFKRFLEEIITPDVFTAAHTLRHRNAFTRDDGTPLKEPSDFRPLKRRALDPRFRGDDEQDSGLSSFP